MQLQQGRLKLEVPLVGDPSKGILLYSEAQCNHLNESLRNCGISFDDNVVRTTLEEPGCEKFFIYDFEIESTSFSDNLLLAIRHFLYAIQRDPRLIPHFLKSTVIVHTATCFSKEVVSCHRSIPVAAICFGNIQGGVFINHWEVSYRNRDECKGRGTNDVEIRVDFLYDQNEVIKISFKDRERNTRTGVNRNVGNRRIVHYQVTVRLNYIRRIIVDNAISDENGRDRTRFHFELNCPVVIRRGFVNNNNNNRGNGVDNVQYYRHREINRGRSAGETSHMLAISDSPVFTIELDESLLDETIYAILSRLRIRSGISIEFASLHLVDKLYSASKCLYGCWTNQENDNVNAVTELSDDTMRRFLEETIRKKDVDPAERSPVDIVRERKFSLLYLIECLISRGAVFKDQLLLYKTIWINFLKLIHFCYLEAREACLCALERLITMIDERKRLGSVMKAFTNEYRIQRKCDAKSALSWQEITDGYRKVRKLVITQSRIIYAVPEVIMANRVLRKHDHDGTRMIRVNFRDDDNQIMRTNKTSANLIDLTLKKHMHDGLKIAGRNFGYLGNSNSQMRDSGAYFLEKYSRMQKEEYKEKHGRDPPCTWQPKIDKARGMLGKFTEVESVPKLMARLGQCFTQTRIVDAPVQRDNYLTTYDFIGGSNKKGNMYTFTDGVGMISKDLAVKVAKEMRLDKCVPSCFQFRFRGMKGVVAVDPVLDDIFLWADKFNIEPPQMEFGSWDVKLVFRPSQIKFKARRTTLESLEVVKYSAPVPVSLNKPFICILDQVSEMQSYDCHLRVTNHIEELVDNQLRGMARTMLREHDCRNKLKELPRRIDISSLSTVAGFQLSTEPFFRSLIRASIKFTITKQMRKQQIQIPCDKGRTMFGVVDETGQLQYGQIFVQYTENINLKAPPPNASRKILTGKVLITKNPCIVAGDVRMFTAVDVPALHHLCDVVVFPMHGPRPHPDEMAGSDLDGDEYAVIWDEDLFLDHNEEPFDYTAEKPECKAINEETLSDDMIDFYIKYITQDSVGTISNSFLFQADLYGIKSEVCQRLAVKISQAVDFTKTGLPPAPLVKDWTIDENSGKEIPPEKNERQPDFHFGNDYDPTYRSPRLMGRIYREFKAIQDVLKLSEDIDEGDKIECDKCLIVDGWTAYEKTAEDQLAKYKGRLRAFMENYGIKTEGEIFSGCISEIRNRISDRDQDDMSLYNTTEVIEKK
ncbi:hypothetical protein KIN20_001310 [Parelaphostrongylus tenuis]|uniref:RNA-dependent RNA polymerase n=1 Tax=Parelaphostrongylus tenuis TaxID=148309 RepID=A0AAD5QG60_PARTN|nr:hypothetical protein KIN20_001310 [Parelaphostrongylus tenuis]